MHKFELSEDLLRQMREELGRERDDITAAALVSHAATLEEPIAAMRRGEGLTRVQVCTVLRYWIARLEGGPEEARRMSPVLIAAWNLTFAQFKASGGRDNDFRVTGPPPAAGNASIRAGLPPDPRPS